MQEQEQLGGRVLVVFDGRCGLCNGVVRWLIARDRRDRMRFVAAEALPANWQIRLGLSGSGPEEVGPGSDRVRDPGSVLAVWNAGTAEERVLERSEAVAALLGELPGPWPAVGAGLRWIPWALRDWGYGVVARGRFRIGGRLASCPVPSEAERSKFLRPDRAETAGNASFKRRNSIEKNGRK